jgi:hypothetical protein
MAGWQLSNEVCMVMVSELNLEYSWSHSTRTYTFRHKPTGGMFKTSFDWVATADDNYILNWMRKVIREKNFRSDLQWPETGPEEKTPSMLEDLIRMYNAAMRMNVRSLIPHLVGPPGVGKSHVMERLAQAAGVTLHTVNVSRISPLEIEGVQMPVTDGDGKQQLELLLNTLWHKLKEGDIVLFDEFLRGFPEVYNGLLDIITSRKVAGHQLPKVFFVAASNSVATYDKALEDRLLHIFVPDLRASMGARLKAKELMARECGFIPEVVKTQEMDEVFNKYVLPTYKMLDYFQGKASLGQVAVVEGKSIRHLVGQVHLREIHIPELKQLVTINNQLAMNARKWQFIVLLDGKNVDPKYVTGATKLLGNASLSEIQACNLDLNLDLIKIEEAMKEEIATQEVEVEVDDTDF